MDRSLDTIAALATPAGTSAIAVVRASGPDCAELGRAIFGETPPPRFAQHADYRDRTGTVLDDVLVTFFAGPKSYTGEDTLEISSHGNPFIAQKILEDLLARGCRAAEAGEFTRRAFLNGRLDLSQAEAVMDLIHARSERALAAANQQLRGSLGRHLAVLTEELLGVLARVEAYIDFPDEDLPAEDRGIVARGIERVTEEAGRLLATQHYGELLRDGITTVIVGEPNAGKSSLLNRLVGRERALVSSEPGTTRDFIEERLIVGPHCLRLVDTAGLNPSPAPLEKLGMEKTLERAAEADLFLLVLDATRPHPALPAELLVRLSAENAVVVLNKMDLGNAAMGGGEEGLVGKEIVRVSAKTGEGMDALITAVIRRAEAFRRDQGDEIIAINARHAAALERARDCLGAALANLQVAGPIELLASDLRGALDALAEIGGKIDNERMLDHLFATFCIGK
ncbi:MAG: tRNA uridine-5-carboxymethylaminomethyl(34) synthesis GTPase MnmE [Nibricoccus sp.]